MTPAQEWGAELRRAMTRQSIPVKELARVMGYDKARIITWRNGRSLPLLEAAQAASEALMSPALLALCVRLRTRVCEVCEREYVSNHRGGREQKWCGEQCMWTGRQRKKAADYARHINQQGKMWRRRALDRQDAIDAMCWSCEPLGTCKEAECPLRSVSPLPLVGELDVDIPMPGTIRRHMQPAVKEHRRDYHREWMRRKRAKEAAA